MTRREWLRSLLAIPAAIAGTVTLDSYNGPELILYPYLTDAEDWWLANHDSPVVV